MSNHDLVFLSRRGTMQLLRVSERTFASMLAAGVIPAGIPCGKRVRWSRSAIIAHLNARTAAVNVSRAA